MSELVPPHRAAAPVTYRRVAHVAWRRIGHETVVVDLKSKRVYAFNAPGGDLWHVLVPGGQALAAESPAAAEFLASLLGLGLVEAVTSGDDAAARSGALLAQHAEPPCVIWRDEIRNFGVSCLQTPIQGGCQARPTT